MKWNKEMKTAVFFACFAVFYLIMTAQIKTFDLYSTSGLNSQSMPRLYGILMLILSAVLFLTSLAKEKKTPAKEGEKKPVATVTVFGRTVPRKPLYLALSILLFAFYAATYASLGFVLSGFLYLALMIMLLTPQRHKSKKMTVFTWVFSFVFVWGLYMIFTRALGMMLPRGILG